MMKNSRLAPANGRLGRKAPYGSTAKLHTVRRYAAARGITALAGDIVGVVDLTLRFQPFLVFAIGTGLTAQFYGPGPCVLSITLGALASDFLFVRPRYEFSLNSTNEPLVVQIHLSGGLPA
jgi:K+-sensing histidine kinase KdpD